MASRQSLVNGVCLLREISTLLRGISLNNKGDRPKFPRMNAFEVELLKSVDRMGLRAVPILVAVSGGRDSMVLLEALSRVAPRRDLVLIVTHIHHGTSTAEQTQYRDRTLRFVGEQAAARGLPFVSICREMGVEGENALGNPESEAALRRFRHQALEKCAQENRASTVAFAHHGQDLFETRYIRLMRGVGPQGLPAMRETVGKKWRPFLKFWPDALEDYAKSRNVEWLEDPSNQDQGPLRNWLRGKIWPALERKRPGTLKRFAASLESIVALDVALGADVDTSLRAINEKGVIRNRIIELSKPDQRRVLAQYLRTQGVKNYTAAQIDEILKRLDSSQNDFMFKVAKRDWAVDAQHIWVKA